MADEGDPDSDRSARARDDEGVRLDDPDTPRPHQAPPSEGPVGWQGWLLFAAVVVSFLIVPGAILYLPQAEPLIAGLGLTLRDAYLVLPLVPALGLGALAAWAALQTRR